MKKRALILFEVSRSVSDTFEKYGVETYSVDILPNEENHPKHIIGDVFQINNEFFKDFDFIGAHPPCTYLTFANCGGQRDWKKTGFRGEKTIEAIKDFNLIYNKIWATGSPGYIENPPFSPYVKEFIKYPYFNIEAKKFGANSNKRFRIYPFSVPPLIYTCINHNNIHVRSSSSTDKKSRNYFPKEIGKAMVQQWLKYI